MLVATVLSACGGSGESQGDPAAQDPSTERCGAGDIEGEASSFAFENFVTQPYYEWLRVPASFAPAAIGAGRDPHPDATLYDFKGATVLRSGELGTTTEVFLDDETKTEFDAHAESERLLAVALGIEPPLTGYSDLVVAVGSDGSLTLADPCAPVRWSENLEAIAEVEFDGADGTAVTALLAAIDDPGAVPAVIRRLSGREPEVDWSSLSPDDRIVSREQAPADVVARFRRARITIAMPPGWSDLDFLFCTRTDVGWNDECASSHSAAQPEYPVSFAFAFVPGDDVQLHIVADDHLSTLESLALLATIPTGDQTANQLVVLHVDVEVTSTTSLVAAIEGGHVRPAVRDLGGTTTPL